MEEARLAPDEGFAGHDAPQPPEGAAGDYVVQVISGHRRALMRVWLLLAALYIRAMVHGADLARARTAQAIARARAYVAHALRALSATGVLTSPGAFADSVRRVLEAGARRARVIYYILAEEEEERGGALAPAAKIDAYERALDARDGRARMDVAWYLLMRYSIHSASEAAVFEHAVLSGGIVRVLTAYDDEYTHTRTAYAAAHTRTAHAAARTAVVGELPQPEAPRMASTLHDALLAAHAMPGAPAIDCDAHGLARVAYGSWLGDDDDDDDDDILWHVRPSAVRLGVGCGEDAARTAAEGGARAAQARSVVDRAWGASVSVRRSVVARVAAPTRVAPYPTAMITREYTREESITASMLDRAVTRAMLAVRAVRTENIVAWGKLDGGQSPQPLQMGLARGSRAGVLGAYGAWYAHAVSVPGMRATATYLAGSALAVSDEGARAAAHAAWISLETRDAATNGSRMQRVLRMMASAAAHSIAVEHDMLEAARAARTRRPLHGASADTAAVLEEPQARVVLDESKVRAQLTAYMGSLIGGSGAGVTATATATATASTSTIMDAWSSAALSSDDPAGSVLMVSAPERTHAALDVRGAYALGDGAAPPPHAHLPWVNLAQWIREYIFDMLRMPEAHAALWLREVRAHRARITHERERILRGISDAGTRARALYYQLMDVYAAEAARRPANAAALGRAQRVVYERMRELRTQLIVYDAGSRALRKYNARTGEDPTSAAPDPALRSFVVSIARAFVATRLFMRAPRSSAQVPV